MGTFIFNPVSGTDFGEDNVYTPKSNTISVTYVPYDEYDLAELVSCNVVANYNDSSMILSNGVSSCSIIGEYTLELFPGTEVKYISKGSSDKLETPTTKTNTNDVPDNKDLFSGKPDSRSSILITYTVTATTDDSQEAIATYTYTTTQTYDAMRDWLVDYIANNQGA